LAGTVIEAAYFFRVVQAIYFKGPAGQTAGARDGGRREEAPLSALAPILALLVLIVVLGVCPGLITRVLDAAGSELLNRLDYIRGVLG